MSVFAERNAGDSFGSWVVIGRGGKPNYVRCRCACGVSKDVYVTSLRSGRSVSCGCVRSEVLRGLRTTHGEAAHISKTKEYRTWAAIKNRCYNERSQDYASYGGRGIRVCSSWRNSFSCFLEDMGRAISPTHSIDRIDNNGPYAPWNCRWATAKQQASHTRKTNRRRLAEGRRGVRIS